MLRLPAPRLRPAPLLFIVQSSLLFVACASNPITEAARTHEQSLSEVQESIITTDELSLHSRQVLAILDLSEAWAQRPADVPEVLEKTTFGVPDWQRRMAIAEVHYALAKRERNDLRKAQGSYMGALLEAVVVMRERGDIGSLFDPRHRLMAEIYNRAIARVLAIGQMLDGHPSTWREVPTPRGPMPLVIRSGPYLWDADTFDEFVPSEEVAHSGFLNHYRVYGAGAPLIAIRLIAGTDRAPAPYRPKERIIHAATGIMRPVDGNMELWFVNPLKQRFWETQNGQTLPLSVDFSAMLGYGVARSRVVERENQSLFDPETMRQAMGLFMLEPYDPKKIPLVCVHGLWSSPITWVHFVNEIYGDERLRERYQIWTYWYPSGLSLAVNGHLFRRALQSVRRDMDPENDDPAMQNMVLVGHSMGGLLSKMMVQDSGDDMWNRFFTKPFDQVEGTEEDLAILKGAFFLKRQPFIKRIVFISTPHRGSGMADGLIGAIGSALISTPDVLEGLARRIMARNPGLVKDTPDEDVEFANSIDNLSEDSPALTYIADLGLPADLPFHSIIGDETGEGSPEGSDGVVPYKSSHLEGARSELIVKSGHNANHDPSAILEVRRILRLHAGMGKR